MYMELHSLYNDFRYMIPLGSQSLKVQVNYVLLYIVIKLRPITVVYAKSLQLCPNLCDPVDCAPTRLLCPRGSPGKNTGVGYHFLLQGIFPTQGSNTHLWCLSPAFVGRFFTTSTTWKVQERGLQNRKGSWRALWWHRMSYKRWCHRDRAL